MHTSDWVATLLGIAGVVAAVAAIPSDTRHRGASIALCVLLVGAGLVVAVYPMGSDGPSSTEPSVTPSAPPPPTSGSPATDTQVTEEPAAPTVPATRQPRADPQGSGGQGRAVDPTLNNQPPPVTPSTGPSLSVSPGSLQVGDTVTFTGSGFEPNSGVAFRFENSSRISWPIDQVFAAADGTGAFRQQGTFAINVCDMSGHVEAFYDSNDMIPDAGGNLPQPVAATSSVVVRC